MFKPPALRATPLSGGTNGLGVNGDGEDHWGFFIFGEEVADGLDELEVEVLYSALVFFDLFRCGGLFDDWSKSSFGDDEGLMG